MAPGYGISSIGNYANDPYFMYAYNGYNPNFWAFNNIHRQHSQFLMFRFLIQLL